MPREKSAGAIIFRKEDNKIYYLLLHYAPGHWEFPKGHIEKDEKEEDTLRREVFEETGINDLKIIPGFKKHIKYFFKQYKDKISEEDKKRGKVPWVFKIVTFFISETKIKDIKISLEHQGWIWLPFEQAVEKVTLNNSKKLLKEAHNYLLKFYEKTNPILSKEGL